MCGVIRMNRDKLHDFALSFDQPPPPFQAVGDIQIIKTVVCAEFVTYPSAVS